MRGVIRLDWSDEDRSEVKWRKYGRSEWSKNIGAERTGAGIYVPREKRLDAAPDEGKQLVAITITR